MKKQSFVCYARVTNAGIQRVLYKTNITPGDDVISKNDSSVRNAAFIGTYLKDVVESNTLFPVVEALAATVTEVETVLTSMIAGIQTGMRNRVKIGLIKITSGANANKPALLITTVSNGIKASTVLPLIP